MLDRIFRFNEFVAIKLTLMLSSIWCVYTFFVWSIIPLFAPGMEQICMYISSTVVQLVALPLLAVGQSLLGQNTEQRALEDHNTLMEAIGSIRHLMNEEDAETNELGSILDRLTAIEALLKPVAEVWHPAASEPVVAPEVWHPQEPVATVPEPVAAPTAKKRPAAKRKPKV